MNNLKGNRNDDNVIEWIVAIAVTYTISFSVLRSLFGLFFPALQSVFILSRNIFLILLLYFQVKHYGLRIKNKPFVFFFFLYCIYLFVYLYIKPIYKLEDLHQVPNTLLTFIFGTIQIVVYMLCADIVFKYFNTGKFLIVTTIITLLPSLFLIQYIGPEVLKRFGADEDMGVSMLAMGYSNSPMFVLSILFFYKIFSNKVISVFYASLVIIAVLYIIILGGERGPLVWSLANLLICNYLLSKNTNKYILLSFFVFLFVFINIEFFIDGLKRISPNAAERIESTVKEGDTNGRFNLDNPEGSTYIIGWNQFLTSPFVGSYFRMITNHKSFRGHYPHNVFIEVLMTMGLLGFIPFVYFLYKGWKRVCYVIKSGRCLDGQFACFVLFLSTFLQLQTTWSIVLNLSFWPFFYMMCVFDMPIKEKTSIGHIYMRIRQNEKEYYG